MPTATPMQVPSKPPEHLQDYVGLYNASLGLTMRVDYRNPNLVFSIEVGSSLGSSLGSLDGRAEGSSDGSSLGSSEGSSVGSSVGSSDGTTVGSFDGSSEGSSVGRCVGADGRGTDQRKRM